MAFIDLQIAARSLGQHRRRSLLLGGATATVTALLVLLVALTDGVQETIIRSGSTLMTGHVNVGGFYKVTAGTTVPLVLDYEKVLEVVLPEVQGLDYAVGRGRGYAKAVAAEGSMDLVLAGLDLQKDRGFSSVVAIVDGDLRGLEQPNTILLFQTEAKKLHVKAGDTLTLSAPTYRGMANTADVRVAAVAKDLGVVSYFTAFMPFETLRNLYQLRAGSTGAIHLYLKDYEAAPQIAERLRTVLAQKGWRVMEPDSRPFFMKLMFTVNKEDWTGQKLDVTTWADELSMMNQIIAVVRALNLFLLGILLVIICAGVMSTMWIAIRERTREIGTLRAIGMQRGRVLVMFLTEAFLLGLLGTSIGALLGCAVAAGINSMRIGVPEAMQWILMSDHIVLAVHPGKVLLSAVSLTLLTSAAALFPSIQAARLKPVTAMHHIG
jgi:ABC-type lipoprotein release transport system permease subunit